MLVSSSSPAFTFRQYGAGWRKPQPFHFIPFVPFCVQEEETSAAVAQATNSLRRYAQQLLNQAAEKLERFVTHLLKGCCALNRAKALLQREFREAVLASTASFYSVADTLCNGERLGQRHAAVNRQQQIRLKRTIVADFQAGNGTTEANRGSG